MLCLCVVHWNLYGVKVFEVTSRRSNLVKSHGSCIFCVSVICNRGDFGNWLPKFWIKFILSRNIFLHQEFNRIGAC